MDIYEYGESGQPLIIDGQYVCVNVSPSGQIYPFRYGSTGRSNYVDKNGNLCVKLPDNQIAKFHIDTFDNLDHKNKIFILTYKPKKLSLFWNGIRMINNLDFTLSNKTITTKFKPYAQNNLIAKYIY